MKIVNHAGTLDGKPNIFFEKGHFCQYGHLLDPICTYIFFYITEYIVFRLIRNSFSLVSNIPQFELWA